MYDSLKSVIEALATIGTLVIAFAALVVAKRQTTAAEQQASIAADLKELSAIQSRAAESQADAAQAQLEQAKSGDAYLKFLQTPQLVPANAEYLPAHGGGMLRFTLVNVGGWPALDVWIEEIRVVKPGLDLTGNPDDYVCWVRVGQRIDVVVKEALVSFEVDLPANFDAVEKVFQMRGDFHDVWGASHEIDYGPGRVPSRPGGGVSMPTSSA